MPSHLKIIDNFLPTVEFLKLQEIVMSTQFPWFYIDAVSLPPGGTKIKDSLAIETDGFNHVIHDREWNVTSFAHEYFDVFFDQLKNQLGFTKENIIRSRASMKTPKVGFTQDNYNLPHVDYYYPHHSLIYYMNDSDGDTRVFDQWFTPIPGQVGIGYDRFTTEARISPKANRLVWIDGLQYHTASNPINSSRRVIININLDPI
jgi:hypothetical protein